MALASSSLVENRAVSNLSSSTRMPWDVVRSRLEAASGAISPAVTSFLSANIPRLAAPHDPFPRTRASLDKLNSGKVELGGGGNAVQVSKEEQALVLSISDRFDLDEVESLVAFKALKKEARAGNLSDDDWDLLTAYVFEERTAVLDIVALLLRCSDDSLAPCGELASNLLPSILVPDFTSNLLQSFAQRTTRGLPEGVRASPQHSLFWTKQLIREQKALLEIVFLVYYSVAPSGQEVVSLLDILRATQWGQRQETFGYFDTETATTVKELSDLLTVIAVEALDLETVISREYPIPSPSEKAVDRSSIFHPDNLEAINKAIEALVQSDGIKSAPILLGWAFVLSRVTNSLVERGVPESYHAFASQSLRVESNTSANNKQPLFQLYVIHALSPSCNVFLSLVTLLHSTIFGSTLFSEPNSVGYISVLRALVTCVPLIVRLSFLTSEQYASLVDVFSALYGHVDAPQLRAQFWANNVILEEEDGMQMTEVDNVGEDEIVQLAKSRFPVQFGSFVKIVKALCAHTGKDKGAIVDHATGADEEEREAEKELAARSAACAFSYVRRLDTLTHVVRPTSAVTPLPYEVIGHTDGSKVTYRATRPIPVSNSLVVPVGTIGKLVSQQGRKPVVIAWDLEWSGWKLFRDVLGDFVGQKGRSSDVFAAEIGNELPIEWESEEERERDVTNVLDILRTVLLNDSSLGIRIVEHMSSETTSTHFVEVLFRILERTLTGQQQSPRTLSTTLVSSLLGLISAFLPSYPGVIWTFLRGSTLLFPSPSSSFSWSPDASRHAILQHEKLEGSYPVTLAILNFVQALVLEDQRSSYAVPTAWEEIKQGVLVRALVWIRDDVWSTCGTWRFANLAEKYEMTSRMVQIYSLILEEGELCPTREKGTFDPVVSVVVDCFLLKPTAPLLSPLLSSLAAGPGTITILRKASRFADAQISEDLVESSLILLKKLLRLRRGIAGSTPSTLERHCLTQIVSQSAAGLSTTKPELFESLARFVVATIDPRTSIQAAKVLTLLCISSNDWQPRPPNIISLLGGSERTEGFVSQLLEIVVDPMGSETLQVAIWDLISSIVEAQPSLAMVFVTGRHYPFGADNDVKGKAPETSLVVTGSGPPPPSRQLDRRTAIGAALETVGTWQDSWEHRPALLSAVLRFFDFTWQHLVDYGTALDEFRSRPAPWVAIVNIAFESAGNVPSKDVEVATYCYRTMAKAHAVRILALDIQASTLRPSTESPTSAKTLLKSLADRKLLSSVLLDATATFCKPSLHEAISALLHESFPQVQIEALRLPSPSHALDDSREFGSSYLYSLPMLRRKLDGITSDVEDLTSQDKLVDAVANTSEINLNFSLLDAQISNTRSWRQLLEIVLPLLRRDTAATGTVLSVAPLIAAATADEDRVGQIMAAIHEERLSILLTMVEVLQGSSGSSSLKVKEELVDLLAHISRIFVSVPLPPLESVARISTPSFHRTLFRIAFFVFRKLNVYAGVGRDLFHAEQKVSLAQSTDIIFRVMISATKDLLELARARTDVEVEQDLALATAVVSQIVSSPFAPPSSIWLAHCQSVDLFRHAFEVFVYMKKLEGRILYAQHVLDLCLAMASSSPRAAEQMALEGIMTALTNNALTAIAEAGAIPILTMEGERSQEHELWTSMLALVVALVSALGDSTQFIEQEAIAFVRLYGPQIASSMAWNAETSITIAGLTEMQNVLSLMYGLLRQEHGSTTPVAATFADQALHLLQQIVFVILHPNHLSTLVEAITPEERAWLEQDTSNADDLDLAKRPVVGSVTLALVKVARILIDLLLAYTQSFSVLLKDNTEWKMDRAIVIPTATVTSNEKSSIGTLFDLASFCLDILRQPPNPTVAHPTPPSLAPLAPFSTEILSQDAQHTLEAVLLLSATQLALWLYRPATPSRASAAMHREITGELAGDLLAILDKVGNLGKTAATGEKNVRFLSSSGGAVATPGRKELASTGTSPGKSLEAVISPELVKVLKDFVKDRLIE